MTTISKRLKPKQCNPKSPIETRGGLSFNGFFSGYMKLVLYQLPAGLLLLLLLLLLMLWIEQVTLSLGSGSADDTSKKWHNEMRL